LALADPIKFATLAAAGDGKKRSILTASSTILPRTRSRIGLSLRTEIPVFVVFAVVATIVVVSWNAENRSVAGFIRHS